jgi:hypothetical protein
MLSLWCEVLLGQISTDPAIGEVSRMTFGSNTMWPAGAGGGMNGGMPIFFSVSVREGIDPARAGDVLRERVLALAPQAARGGSTAILRSGIEALSQPPDALIALMKQQLKAGGVAPVGMNPEHLMLGNATLQIGFRAMLTGPDPKAWATRVAQAARDLEPVVQHTFRAESAKVVILKPAR